MDRNKSNQIKIFDFFLPYQKRIFLLLSLFFIITVLFFFSLSYIFLEKKPDTTLSYADYSQCQTNFCKLMIKTQQHPKDIARNTYNIGYNNFRTSLYNMFESKYLLLGPIVDLFDFGSSIGILLFNDTSNTLTQVLFPHGFVEIIAFIFVYSLYYSITILLVVSTFKKKRNPIQRSFIIALIMIFPLFLLAGLLESIAIATK